MGLGFRMESPKTLLGAKAKQQNRTERRPTWSNSPNLSNWLKWWQAHYEELKADRDSAEHQVDETARQLSRVEKQLKESQDALSNSAH